MSVFSGQMYKGARRAHGDSLVMDAYNRALRIWNDGTGYLYDKESAHGKHVQHPYFKLPRKVRDQLGTIENMPVYNKDFPKDLHVSQLVMAHRR